MVARRKAEAYLPPLTSTPAPTLSQESGMVHMGDLALQYNLGSELLSAAITSRMGSIIRGRIDGGLLYTPTYIRRCGN